MTYSNGISLTAVATPLVDPEVKTTTRRRYTSKFKLRTLQKADALAGGEIASFLRKEGLYASMLHRWREERDKGLLDASKGVSEGPADKELSSLRRKIQQLESKLQQAKTIVDAQKKLLSLFDYPEDGMR